MPWRGRGRHRVESFARGVEGDVGSCPDDPGTSRLVGLAHALRSVPLRPSPELTLAVRRRIVNAARAGLPDEPRPSLAGLWEGIRLQRGLASMTALLTAAFALVSIGFGTTQALPGDTLYGLKLRGESITIALSGSEEAKGYNYLRFAGARLMDVSGLIDHDGAWRESVVTTADRVPNRHLAHLVNSTLTTMNVDTDRGAAALRRVYQRTGDPAPLAYLDDFTQDQHRKLSSMLGRLPAESQAAAGASLSLVDRLAKETDKLLTEQCIHAVTCRSQPRQSDDAASTNSPTTTPTEAPATSLTSSIATSGSSARQSGSQGTSPQRVPSTTEQPPSTTTPTNAGTPNGDQPSSAPSSSPSTNSGSTSGTDEGSATDSSTSGDTTDSASSQPSPPQPTGVPSTSGDRSTGAPASPDASSPATTSGSGNGATAGSDGSDDPGSASSGADAPSAPPSGSVDPGSADPGSGDQSGGDTSGGAGNPAPAGEPTDPSRSTASDPSGSSGPSGTPPDQTTSQQPSESSDPSGAPPDQTTSDEPSGDSTADATPTP